MDNGEKIAALRKENGMTQAELGKTLNVTFQAVSKWERGESSPDFVTMSRIAKLFNVPLSYFEEDDGEEAESEEPEEEEELEEEEEQEEAPPPPKMLGVCKTCGKVVYEGDEYETSPFVLCKACHDREVIAKRKAEEEKRRAEEAERTRQAYARQTHLSESKRKRNRGMIWAAVICVIFDILAIIGAVQSNDINVGEFILGFVIINLFGFAYISQVFWGGMIIDVTFFAVKVFGGWGVLFTFDLEGFIFLIVMKLLMFLLKILIVIVTFIFSFSVAVFISPFTFVPQLLKINRGAPLRD